MIAGSQIENDWQANPAAAIAWKKAKGWDTDELEAHAKEADAKRKKAKTEMATKLEEFQKRMEELEKIWKQPDDLVCAKQTLTHGVQLRAAGRLHLSNWPCRRQCF